MTGPRDCRRSRARWSGSRLRASPSTARRWYWGPTVCHHLRICAEGRPGAPGWLRGPGRLLSVRPIADRDRLEAVDIRRRLAHTCPDAFLPDLARTLAAQGRTLSQAERHSDAAGAFREALAVIAPFVERNAWAFVDLARALAGDHTAACEKAGILPDIALIERVLAALKVKADAILDTAAKTGALDEDALAEMPSELAGWVRATWAAAQAGSGGENA